MDSGGSGPASGTLNDYPKFGIWTDCLYMSANEFKGTTYKGSAFASFERSSLYAGATLDSTNSSIGIVPFSNQTGGPFTMLPSNLLGTSTNSLPPAGRPNFYVSEALSGTAFEVRKFTPGQNGGHSCGTGGTMSAATLVPHATYTDLSGGDIVPQKNTTNQLDSLYFRLMQKAQYRKIGSAESLWVVHSVRNTNQNVGSQWAQMNVSGGTIATSVVQQQLYRPDTTLYRWMGSLAVDAQGNMALAYSTSSGSSFPGIAYSGRLAGDPLNNLPQAETVLVAGADSQTNNCGGGPCARWGDYSSLSIDPSDDCTFWYTTEYFRTAGNGSAGNWNTRIGSFKFPACSNIKQSQTINFTSSAPVGATFGGAPQVVTATATSGLATTLTIDASATSVCALNGSGSGSQVSFIGVGTCKINANQSGNGSFNPAPAGAAVVRGRQGDPDDQLHFDRTGQRSGRWSGLHGHGNGDFGSCYYARDRRKFERGVRDRWQHERLARVVDRRRHVQDQRRPGRQCELQRGAAGASVVQRCAGHTDIGIHDPARRYRCRRRARNDRGDREGSTRRYDRRQREPRRLYGHGVRWSGQPRQRDDGAWCGDVEHYRTFLHGHRPFDVASHGEDTRSDRQQRTRSSCRPTPASFLPTGLRAVARSYFSVARESFVRRLSARSGRPTPETSVPASGRSVAATPLVSSGNTRLRTLTQTRTLGLDRNATGTGSPSEHEAKLVRRTATPQRAPLPSPVHAQLDSARIVDPVALAAAVNWKRSTYCASSAFAAISAMSRFAVRYPTRRPSTS
jgi:hypothetical protein